MDRQFSVERSSLASAESVCALLRHHPETALAAILALSYPATHAHGAHPMHLHVGGVVGSTSDVAHVSLEWETTTGASATYGFTGELIVTSRDGGSHLELKGILRGGPHDDEALARVLGWLSSASAAGVSDRDRR